MVGLGIGLKTPWPC